LERGMGRERERERDSLLDYGYQAEGITSSRCLGIQPTRTWI